MPLLGHPGRRVGSGGVSDLACHSVMLPAFLTGRVCQVAIHPGSDCRRGVFCCTAAGVNPVGNVAAKPPAELGLLLNVAASPGRTGNDPLPPEMVWAIERDEMDFPDPATGGQPFQMLRNERAQQYRRHPTLGNAVRNGQPCVAKCRPSDGLATAELTCGVEEPVDVEGDTAALQPPGERGEYGGLPRSGSARDDKQRSDGTTNIAAPALGAYSAAIARLHDDRAVARLAVVHTNSMPDKQAGSSGAAARAVSAAPGREAANKPTHRLSDHAAPVRVFSCTWTPTGRRARPCSASAPPRTNLPGDGPAEQRADGREV